MLVEELEIEKSKYTTCSRLYKFLIIFRVSW